MFRESSSDLWSAKRRVGLRDSGEATDSIERGSPSVARLLRIREENFGNRSLGRATFLVTCIQ